MGKMKLMKAASAMRKRMEQRVDSQTTLLATRVQALLQDHPHVGASDSGLIKKTKETCCRYSATYIPWTTVVSTTLTRNCLSGAITVAATSNVDLAGNGNPTGGNCGEDYTYNTVIIKTSKAVSEGLQKQLSLITGKDFLHMEELPGIDIRNKYGHAKATLAGMLLQSQTGCNGLVKSFIPWGSMTMMAYKAPNCCSQGGLVIGDHLQTPINVGPVSPKDFESVRSIFSQNVAEDGRRSEKSAAKSTTPKKQALELKEDGIYETTMTKCGAQLLFIPWAKIGGLVMKIRRSVCFYSVLYLVTEAGQCFKVMEGRNTKLLWEKFDEIQALKFGTLDPDLEKTIFNSDDKDSCKACILTEQSLRMCLDEGRTIVEVDLDRVVGVRDSLFGMKILEVALRMGRTNKCTVLRVELGEHENGEQLCIAIREHAKQRKNYVKSLTGLVA